MRLDIPPVAAEGIGPVGPGWRLHLEDDRKYVVGRVRVNRWISQVYKSRGTLIRLRTLALRPRAPAASIVVFLAILVPHPCGREDRRVPGAARLTSSST